MNAQSENIEKSSKEKVAEQSAVGVSTESILSPEDASNFSEKEISLNVGNTPQASTDDDTGTTSNQPAAVDTDDDDVIDENIPKDILATYIPPQGLSWSKKKKAMYLAQIALKQLSKNKKMSASVVHQAFLILAKARELSQEDSLVL